MGILDMLILFKSVECLFMNNNILNYKDFFNTNFALDLKKAGISTEDLILFVNSLVGVKNFMKHHPIPIINYYWEKSLGYSKIIESLAQKMSIPLKHIKRPDEYTKEEVMLCCKWDGHGPGDYGGIKAVKKDIGRASHIVDLTSNDIIQNESLWEESVLVESHSQRHSSDEFEYHHLFKTGWAYLRENNNIILDYTLIFYLKDKIIPLTMEQTEDYAGFRFGRNPIWKDTTNGLMAFRTHTLDDSVVPMIINNPLQWEGVFYDIEFCNHTILEYVNKIFPDIECVFDNVLS